MVEPLFFDADLRQPAAGESFRLTGTEAKHASVVRRMRSGEAIQVTNGKGLRLRGTVSDSKPDAVEVLVSEVVQEPAPNPELTMVQALAKGDRDELAIQAATELGIDRVIPWQAERCISRWEGAKIAKSVERWQQICLEAAKQALRVWVPQVSELVSSKQLAKLCESFDLVLVLDPTAKQGIAGLQLEGLSKLAIVVGPEGGITDAELNLLEENGAVRVHLGSGILRTSTAGMAAIAVLQANLGRWSTSEID
jgi:16S rRNA (uracil1498-N3)-methyltransferase